MSQYDNTNTGLLATNERKQTEKHPDYSGSINIEGVEYWLSGWKRTGKAGKLAGKQFLSLAVKPKDGASAQRPAQAEQQQPRPETETKTFWNKPPGAAPTNIDEDVPF